MSRLSVSKTMKKIEKLICAVQNYEWGRIGTSSTVATLKQSSETDFVLNNSKPYAELWMGVHPNGPSMLASSKEPLSKMIEKRPSSVGQHEMGTLQFLFKVLSVNKALSIQSHPTKEKAKILHARDPSKYPDDNHKPEMAIALTDFQLLCGFRPSQEIIANIKDTPELFSLLRDNTNVDSLNSTDENVRRNALRGLFGDYMKAPQNKIADSVAKLTSRLANKAKRSDLDELIIRLNKEFPGDVGVFAPLLLNYFTLKKGESVFLGPNVPHAYLFGDCMECMACSDNTVRAGLTPKYKDVETLCSDLTFEMSPPPYFKPKQISPHVIEYAPPVTEFAVQEIHNGADVLPDVKASSIIIIIEGNAELKTAEETISVKRGEILFVPADSGPIRFQSAHDLLAYRAFTPAP